MTQLKIPKSRLKKKMHNLILDSQARDIKFLLFKKGQSIPALYKELNPLLKSKKVYISQSTFKNMLMKSSTQRCDWEIRLKVIDLIFEYLDSEKINAAYEGVKLLRDKEIRSIMELLKSDYKDKREYLPEEIFIHEMEDLPADMKKYWESWKEE